MSNRAPNPSFEVDLAGWSASGAGNTATHDSSDAKFGSACARIDGTGTVNRVFEWDDNTLVPVTPGQVWSAGAWGKAAVGTPRNVRVDIRWRDSLGAAFDAAFDNSVGAPDWTQATTLAKTAPAGAAFATVRTVYLNPAAGDAVLVDGIQLVQRATLPEFGAVVSAFMPDITVEVAFSTPPDDPAPVWTDVSDFVEAHTPVTISRGRPDELSQVQPSRLQVTFDNTDGRFTPENTLSPYYPNVKKDRMIRVSATPVGSTLRRRFTGYVDEWPVEWPSGTDEYASATVTASSRRSRLAATVPLRSIIVEEVLLDDPTAYYPLGETFTPPAPGRAGDVSGNQQPDLVAAGTGPGVTWASATGPGTDDMSAPVFSDGRYLVVTYPEDKLIRDTMSVECFFNTTDSGTVRDMVSMHGPAFYSELGVDTSGRLRAAYGQLGFPPIFTLTSTAQVNDGNTHHAVYRETIVGGLLNAWLFLDGVQVDSVADGSQILIEDRPRLVVGSFAPPGGPQSGGWVGSVSHVALRRVSFALGGVELSAARIAAHADSGLTGFEGDSSDERIARFAVYAGIPPADLDLEPGATTSMALQRTDGKTVLALMEETTDTEGGVLFDAPDGRLTFHARTHRYNNSAAYFLDAALQTIQAGLQARMDGQFLVNDITASRPNGPTVRVVNDASIVEHGLHREQIEVFTTSDGEVLNAANWRVSQYGEPGVRVHSLEVDVINQDPILIDQLLDTEISDQIALEGLPVQAPQPEIHFKVEGITETIGAESYTVGFELSPIEPFEVWTLGTSFSVLDVNTKLAF